MKMPGRYTRKLVLQTITETSDAVGGVTEAATTLATVWAAIKPMTGTRLLEYKQLINGVWYDIEIKYRTDISIVAGNTITYGGRTLTVHSILNEREELRVYLITAYEKA